MCCDPQVPGVTYAQFQDPSSKTTSWNRRINRRMQRVVAGVLVAENVPLQASFVIPYVSNTYI